MIAQRGGGGELIRFAFCPDFQAALPKAHAPRDKELSPPTELGLSSCISSGTGSLIGQ